MHQSTFCFLYDTIKAAQPQVLKEGESMKNWLSLVLSLFILAGCSDVSNSKGLNEDARKDISVIETNSCGIDWQEILFPIDLSEDISEEIKPIKTEQIAIEIAESIIEKLHEEGKFLEYTLISLVHSTEDDIWRFDYSFDQQNRDDNDLVDCGCFSIAVDGTEGYLIKAWIEE